MTKLPQQLPLEQMQNRWAAIINPILSNPLANGRLVPNISLITGTNQVNHKLQRKVQGWMVVGIDGVASIYDAQATNQMPNLTSTLISDADVTVSLWVF